MHRYLSILVLIIMVSLHSCRSTDKKNIDQSHDIESIKKRGKLIAITDYNSTSYFIYRGTPMGFQYELLQSLAKNLRVELEISITNNLEEAFRMVESNDCDIVAINLTVTNDRQQFLSFTTPIGNTRQVLVQRKPDDWKIMAFYNLDKFLIKNPLELAGKTIHVVKNSAFATRLKSLENEIGDSIFIIEEENYDTEQLISLVAKGEIAYTIADENVAMLNQNYYPNIDIGTAISFPQNHAWAVNKNNPLLLNEVNKWIESTINSDMLAVIYNKYYRDMNSSSRNNSPYMSLNGNTISEYDDAIKKFSKTIDWDWRLLASLVYQESRFDPHVNSWAGAFGLMQLMPSTAKSFGVDENSSPENQIKAGVKFIQWIDNQLKDEITDKDERIKFILASYNVGLGHVQDARRLAKAHNANPNIWTNEVDFYLLHKSDPKYFDRELVKYGYCRGEETYVYVKEVVSRYEQYAKIIR